MTEQEKLQAAFPNADDIQVSARDYGFKKGILVRYGQTRHAVKWGGTLDETIITLKRVSRR